MAKEKKVVLERIYNVPLRKEFMKVPPYKRANKAIKALKEFIMRHMKAEEVKLGQYVSMSIWKKGIKHPPHHVKVNAIKDEDGITRVELVSVPKEKEPAKKVKEKLLPKKKEEGNAAEEKAHAEVKKEAVESKKVDEPKAAEEQAQSPKKAEEPKKPSKKKNT